MSNKAYSLVKEMRSGIRAVIRISSRMQVIYKILSAIPLDDLPEDIRDEVKMILESGWKEFKESEADGI